MKQQYDYTIRQKHKIIYERQQALCLYGQTSFPDNSSSFEFIQQLFPSWVVLLCSIRNQSVRYISENCINLFGHTAQKMQGMTLEEFVAAIHPDDHPLVSRCMQQVTQLIQEIPCQHYYQYRFVINYRYRHTHGSYFHLYDEQLALRNKEGQQLFVNLYKNIAAEKPFSYVKLEVSKLEKVEYKIIEEYAPKLPLHTITRREREILQLIQHGQSNKEIADRLCISEHTVRNHRSNLFEKTKARNVIELLNYAKAFNWI